MVSINAFYIVILCTAVPASANWTNNDPIALAEATAFIIRQHFSRITNTVVIVEKSGHPLTQILNTRVVEHILLDLQDTIAVQLYFGQSEYQPWDYHVFVVDSVDAFREVRMSFPRTKFDRKFRFLIILTHVTPKFLFVLRQLFILAYELHVINANVILNHPKLGVCMYTYILFKDNMCRFIQPKLYFKFKDSFESLTQVFPFKLFNFNKCPIRVCARLNPPMLTFSGNRTDPKSEDNWKNFDGIEGQLLKNIARILNFTIELLPFPTERSYIDNNASYGCFAELLNGNADVAIGGFSAADPKRLVLSPSILYHFSPVVFIVRSGHELASIRRLARPFNRQLWDILAIFLIAVILVVQVLRAVRPAAVRRFIIGERNDAPLTNFFAIFLGYPITQMPRRNFARYVVLLWLLMAMIIRNAYQGSLYDSIRMDRFVRIPRDYEELLRWNYKILVPREFNDSDVFPMNSTIVMEGKYDFRFRVLEAISGRYATVALQDHFLSYVESNLRYGTSLKMIKEPLYMQQTAMYFPKHSVYKAAFNRNLQRFSYFGITNRITRNCAKDVYRHGKKEVLQKAISNDRLRGMYEIYLGMLLLAVIVFALELLSVYVKKLQRFLEWIS